MPPLVFDLWRRHLAHLHRKCNLYTKFGIFKAVNFFVFPLPIFSDSGGAMLHSVLTFSHLVVFRANQSNPLGRKWQTCTEIGSCNPVQQVPKVYALPSRDAHLVCQIIGRQLFYDGKMAYNNQDVLNSLFPELQNKYILQHYPKASNKQYYVLRYPPE